MSKIAVIGFDGNPKEWDQWLIKTTAIADAGGWGVAMESDLTGGTPEEKKKNNKGWQYLALALMGTRPIHDCDTQGEQEQRVQDHQCAKGEVRSD